MVFFVHPIELRQKKIHRCWCTTDMIEYLKYIVYMIHNLSLKNDKKELELFCKKNESMIQFLCKSSNDSNVEKKIGFEKIVEKYINI